MKCVDCGCSFKGSKCFVCGKEAKAKASTRDMVPGFGSALKARRLKAACTMQELAAKADTHPTTISKIEGEQRSPSLLLAVKLAKALGCGVDDLVREAGVLH